MTRRGSSRKPPQWALFIDESGCFEDTRDGVVVGGLLVDYDHPMARPGLLSAVPRFAAPDLDWPLHAAFFRVPVFLALASKVAGEGGRERLPSPFDARVDAALEFLGEREGSGLEEALGALRAGALPEMELLKDLTGPRETVLRQSMPRC